MSGQTTLEPAAEVATPAARGDTRRRPALLAALAAAGLVLLGLAAYGLLGHAEPRVAGISRVFPQERIATVEPGREVCQRTRVPADTGAVQVLGPAPGAALTARVRTLGEGGAERVSRAAGAAPGGGLRLGLDRPLRRDAEADVCLSAAGAPVPLLGDRSNGGLTVGGRPVEGAIALTFYRPGAETPADMIPVVAERIGRLRGAFGGPWRMPAIAVLLLVALGLTARLLLGGEHATRRVLLALFGVAACNALAWSLLTPAFQIPDEPAHLSYVQDLVEKGQPPQPFGPSLSPELTIVVDGVGVSHVNFRRDARPPWTAFDDEALAGRLATKPTRKNAASYLPVYDYPPAYYAAVAPAYRAVTAAGGSSLDAITPLRAVSALLGSLTVLAVFGFLRELFPRRRFLALGLALVCAYQPVLTWISGGINPDALLIPVGAAMLWLFARAFQRGLTAGRAAALGGLLALALLTKIAALGLVPGWGAAMALLLWRTRSAGARDTLGRGAIAAACAALPLVVYGLLNAGPWDRPVLPTGVTGGGDDGGAAAEAPAREVSSFAVYLWEYALPRVGQMTDFFHSSWAPKDLWVPIWVGRFGWSDYQFPTVVNRIALVVYAVIALAALVGLVRLLRERRALWAPIAASAVLALGLIVVIAKPGYDLRSSGNFVFEQGRYYMPLIPLFALALALALRLLRARVAHAVVVGLVLVSVLHLGGALALTVQRYYTFSSYIEQETAVADAR